MKPHTRLVILAYIEAVDRYADFCKISEEIPEKHLEVLMHAEGLLLMGKAVRRIIDGDYNENG